MNTRPIPTWDGDPRSEPQQPGRDAVASLDDRAVHVLERGTSYAKPGACRDGCAHPRDEN